MQPVDDLKIMESSAIASLPLTSATAEPNLGQLVLLLEPELASAWIKMVYLSTWNHACPVTGGSA